MNNIEFVNVIIKIKNIFLYKNDKYFIEYIENLYCWVLRVKLYFNLNFPSDRRSLYDSSAWPASVDLDSS